MDTIIQILARELGRSEAHVENVVRLIDEGNTIPFIARYRKELHGAMDDTALRTLADRLQYLRNLDKRREEVKSAIEGQGKLTEELSAAIDAVSILFPEAALGAGSFMVGRLSGVTVAALKVPALLSLLAGAGAFAMSYELDLLTLGDEVAQSLGLSARAARNLLLTLAAVLCGAAVSFAGLVGFVGLLVPHAARFLVGGEHKYLLAASLFLGAALVTVCDLAARVLFVPFELPVGILLSLMGGPFFLWLLFRQRGGRRT